MFVTIRLSKWTRAVLTLVLLSTLVFPNQIALASGASDTTFAKTRISQIDEISKAILLKDIEYERFNVHFRQQYARQGRWKGLRYFAYQESNAGALFSGLIASVAIRARALSQGKLTVDKTLGPQIVYPPLSKDSLIGSLIPQMVGQIIGAGGDGIELAINAVHGWQAQARGFDAKTAVARQSELEGQIIQLLQQRQELIEESNYTSDVKQVLLLEGKLLSDLNNITQAEFRYFYLSSHRLLAFQTALYLLDIGRNVTGAIGNGLGIISANEMNIRLAGTGSILTTISGGFIMAMPLLSRGVGKVDQMIQSKRLEQIFVRQALPDTSAFKTHREQLKQLLDRQSVKGSSDLGVIDKRMSIYQDEKFLNCSSLQLAYKEIQTGRTVAVQNVVSGELIGGTKVANGVLGTIAGYNYPNFPRANFPLVMDGGITYLSGTGMGLLDNIRLQVVAERDRYKLNKDRKLPSQVCADRLRYLDGEEAIARQL